MMNSMKFFPLLLVLKSLPFRYSVGDYLRESDVEDFFDGYKTFTLGMWLGKVWHMGCG